MTIGHRKSVRTFFSQEISQRNMNNRKVLYTSQEVRQVRRNLNVMFQKKYCTRGAEGDQLSLQKVTNCVFTDMSLQPPIVMSV